MLGAVWQGVINGIALGWIYILLALGLTLIYGIMNIVQLAHGELYMLGAYLVFYFAVTRGINIILAALLTMVVLGIIGVFLERFLFRRVRDSFTGAVIISICISLTLISSIQGIFGLFQRSMPKLAIGSFHVLGTLVPRDRVIVVCVALCAMGLLVFFLKGTVWGKAMVASAQNREGAFLVGVNANGMALLAMGVGCGLAGLAGVLGGSLFAISPTMGMAPFMKGLIIIVTGGMGSLWGSVIVGLVLGVIDGVGPIVLSPALTVIIPFVIVIAVLVLRPQGLFGHEA